MNNIQGVLLYIPIPEIFVSILIGSGCNIQKEDLDSGNDSYYDINIFKFDGTGFNIIDGGELLFNSKKIDYHDDIQKLINDSLDLMDIGFTNDDITILQYL